MPVYAPSPAFVGHRRNPRALTAIILVHAVAIAAVMSVKMDLPTKIKRTITEIELIDPPKPPPPEPEATPETRPPPREQVIERTPVIVPIPIPDPIPFDSNPLPLPIPNPGDLGGPAINPVPDPVPIPAESVRVGPRFATPPGQVEPPYPESKRRFEEEAVLKLRLSIDARGRVVAVEPVGRADRTFVEAAREHILDHWRYRPATEDGRAVASTTVITLRFELEG